MHGSSRVNPLGNSPINSLDQILYPGKIRFINENALGQLDCRIFLNFNISKTI